MTKIGPTFAEQDRAAADRQAKKRELIDAVRAELHLQRAELRPRLRGRRGSQRGLQASSLEARGEEVGSWDSSASAVWWLSAGVPRTDHRCKSGCACTDCVLDM